VYVFYIDIRSGGKGYEEFVQEGIEKNKILYLRGKVSKLFKDGNKIMVAGVDTLSNKKVEIAADLVVLVPPMVPEPGTRELAKRLKVPTDEHGFFSEAHPKLKPLESLVPGVFLAGCAQGPKDIPETVSQASGAASKACSLFSRKELAREPTIAVVDENVCGGCGICISVCPYEALSLENSRILVSEAVCEGCGACVAACPAGAIQQRNNTDDQMFKMINAAIK
jgi:heterodisulfide reductase subunit A